MKNIFWVVLCLSMGLAACDKVAYKVADTIGPIADARKAVRTLLFDPYSAHFEDEAVTSRKGVCGFVNAKNQMGGYVGRQPYIYDPANGAAMASPPTVADVQSLADTNPSGDPTSWQNSWTNIQIRCDASERWRKECPERLASMIDTSLLCQAWQSAGGDVGKVLLAVGQN